MTAFDVTFTVASNVPAGTKRTFEDPAADRRTQEGRYKQAAYKAAPDEGHIDGFDERIDSAIPVHHHLRQPDLGSDAQCYGDEDDGSWQTIVNPKQHKQQHQNATLGLYGRWRRRACYEDRVAKLFPDVDPLLRRRLLLDDVALYSVTDQKTADSFSRNILRFVPSWCTVTNATACAGGNTLSFARHFAHVNAIERDALRYGHLCHNMAVLGVENVTTTHADAVDVLFSQQQSSATKIKTPLDVVFIDPPWGGPSYAHHKRLSLFLSGIELSVIVRRLARERVARVVAIKVPLNFDIEKFSANCCLISAETAQKGCEEETYTATPNHRQNASDGIQLLSYDKYSKMCLLILRTAT